MFELPEHLFEAQKRLADDASLQFGSLKPMFAAYDFRSCVAAAGGLLTLPELQANTVRLETICHLAVANAAGGKKPTKQDAARWFKQVGNAVRHMEDPTEDVFTARVWLDGNNYRVLEGLAEGNSHYLQHLLNVLMTMPQRGPFLRLRETCKSLLILSDTVCERAGIEAYASGSEFGQGDLDLTALPTIKTLARRVTFESGDLATLCVDTLQLRRFTVLPGERQVGYGGSGGSILEAKPLVEVGEELIVALPSAIGVAIRRAIITSCLEAGGIDPLRSCLLESQTDQIATNPLISQLSIRPTPVDLSSCVISSAPVEIGSGYWVHLILVCDDFEGFNETSFEQPGPNGKITSDLLEVKIKEASEICRSTSGFKAGLSLIVICGFGRAQMIDVSPPEDWNIEGISSYDLEILGWRSDANALELLKFLFAEQSAAEKGFPVAAINGLVARFGFAVQNDGHVVPHSALPDGAHDAMLMIPTNAHLDLRVRHHKKFDIRSVQPPTGAAIVVRKKDGGKGAPQGIQRIYLSEQDAIRGRYRAVWIELDKAWWAETRSKDGSKSDLYPIFEMQMVWLARIAPLLFGSYSKFPEKLTWRLIAGSFPNHKSENIRPPSKEEIAASIKTAINLESATIECEISDVFFLGLSHAENVSEVSLVRSFVSAALKLAGIEESDLDRLMDDIAPSPSARQLHAFAPQGFRDHVRNAVGRRFARISAIDDGAVRLGLGWHGVARPGGVVRGRDNCTKALNAITTAAEEAFCSDLSRFERRALIERVVRNHEASQIDKQEWERTSGAILALSGDPEASREDIFERIIKANGISLASRIIIEAALCESPLGTGFEIADIDLSRLMAQAMIIHYLGGYSDAIRYEGMKPEIRISPAGEVQIDVDFFESIVNPVGKSFANNQIEISRRDYADLLRHPQTLSSEKKETINADFLFAWEEELGISFDEFRTAIEALEDRLYEADKSWEILSRDDLVSFLSARIASAEEFVSALELVPRAGWKNVTPPYNDTDRQPWRFRRRLSVARRPILRLGTAPESEVLVAPGMLRDAFLVLFHGFYYGNFDIGTLASRSMRKWREHTVAKEANEFEDRVVEQLQGLGWSARRGVKFPQILGGLPDDPGDIDVLAWNADGRVFLLECKDLQFAKTPSEIAKQLSKFRGDTDEKGRLDLLGKHLKRIDLAKAHTSEFEKYLGLPHVLIEGALVFANTVPMNFAAERIGHAVRLVTFSQLRDLVGK